jgi:hypothetical protein
VDWAEIFDTWRVVPRLVLFAYAWWLAHIVDSILMWYFALPQTARGLEASGMASVVITAVTGLGTWVYKVYSDAGRDWSSPPSLVQTTSTSTKSTTVAP